jgi:hypothetical protein
MFAPATQTNPFHSKRLANKLTEFVVIEFVLTDSTLGEKYNEAD